MRRALSSWAIPMMLLDTITPANKASPGKPAIRIKTSKDPIIAFTGVRTFAFTISLVVRTGASGTLFVRPSRIRSSTSARLSPVNESES